MLSFLVCQLPNNTSLSKDPYAVYHFLVLILYLYFYFPIDLNLRGDISQVLVNSVLCLVHCAVVVVGFVLGGGVCDICERRKASAYLIMLSAKQGSH